MFLTERPLAAKLVMRALRLEAGEGRVLARLLLAVMESLLPKLTFHEGPPNWDHVTRENIKEIRKKIDLSDYNRRGKNVLN